MKRKLFNLLLPLSFVLIGSCGQETTKPKRGEGPIQVVDTFVKSMKKSDFTTAKKYISKHLQPTFDTLKKVLTERPYIEFAGNPTSIYYDSIISKTDKNVVVYRLATDTSAHYDRATVVFLSNQKGRWLIDSMRSAN
jgi:hypothetical protein